ncbi:MAG: RtcB family protein [Planctomycetaceae bacterium]|nr:RtcB family protein [Planctomycetaceae bacterium]
MSTPQIEKWLCEPLPKDVSQSIARLAAAEDVQHIAVMPDVHLSGDVCVGLAIATSRLIYPAAVGGDIGCGMAAVACDSSASALDDGNVVSRLLAALSSRVPAMRHSRTTMPELPAALVERPLSDSRLAKLVTRDGRVQLATLGRGNHFLEFQADQEDRLWLMLHSGSRAMGQAITAHHVAIAERQSSRRKLPWLVADSSEGQAYLADVQWAIDYAEESRLGMLRAVEEVLRDLLGSGLDWNSLIHANHNHVCREEHFGNLWWVHRKGALPAGDGVAGIIPGSMGTRSYHVTGRGLAESLCSSSHGAGRAMSRGEAAQAISPKQLAREMRGVWFDTSQARQLCDEAPSAYKDVEAVMRAQRELTRIDRVLRPVLSYKGC